MRNTFSTRAGNRTVEGNDAAERRLAVREKSLCVGLFVRRRYGNAARICMLDDDASGHIKRTHTLPRSIAVGDVVVGEFFALKLFVAGEKAGSDRHFAIESPLLMRILTVAQILNFLPLAIKDGRKLLGLIFCVKARQIIRDHAIVAGSMREDFLCQRKACGCLNFAVSVQFSENSFVVSRINHYGDRFVILRRRANHRRAANIDIFDCKVKRAVRTSNGLFKRIKIHADDIDRINAVFLERGHMFGDRTTGQNAGVDLRIKRLHTAIEHFGEARVVSDFFNLHAFFGKELSRAAGGKNVIALGNQAAGEVNDADLVGDAQKCLLAHSSLFLLFGTASRLQHSVFEKLFAQRVPVNAK